MDFDQAGLLDGLEGEDRAARERLLERLAGEGYTLEELKAAIKEDRLALLLVERVLGGRYTAAGARGANRPSGGPDAADPAPAGLARALGRGPRVRRGRDRRRQVDQPVPRVGARRGLDRRDHASARRGNGPAGRDHRGRVRRGVPRGGGRRGRGRRAVRDAGRAARPRDRSGAPRGLQAASRRERPARDAQPRRARVRRGRRRPGDHRVLRRHGRVHAPRRRDRGRTSWAPSRAGWPSSPTT